MAKEQVNIVFSADSAQARALWQEIAQGAENAGKKVQQSAKHVETFGGSFLKVAAGVGAARGAFAAWNALVQQGTQNLNDHADAFERVQGGFDKIRAEGGLSAGMTAKVRGAVGLATQFAAVDTATAQGVAQQMIEDRFSPEDIASGGLNSLLKGIVAVNARGEGGDPKQLAKQFANIMQTLGRAPNAGNIESTVADVHGLMNATGLDMGGAEGLITSMARASKPKMAKALASVGLTPGQIDPNALGIGAAGQNLANAISGLSDSEQSALLSRLLGDEGATAFIRGREEFRSGAVRSSTAAVENDFNIGTTGTMADLRRKRAAQELSRAQTGDRDAIYRQSLSDLGDKYRNGNVAERIAGAALPWLAPVYDTLLGDSFRTDMNNEAAEYQRSIQVEITTPNGGRVDGRTRGARPLRSLSN